MYRFFINPRRWMLYCGLVGFLMLGILWLVSPVKVPTVLYKVAMAIIAGLAGFFIDRAIFPYAEPSSYLKEDWRKTPFADNPHLDEPDYPVVAGYEVHFMAASLRQACIIIATLLAVAWGL